MEIKWPKGPSIDNFNKIIVKNSTEILYGRVMAIDPGSRSAGYAIFDKGVLIEKGKVTVIGSLSINARLHQIAKEMSKDPPPDILLIEDIGKGRMAHEYLKYSVGAILSGYPTPSLIFYPITIWKAYAKAIGMTEKDDDIDAELIGASAIELAKHLIRKD